MPSELLDLAGEILVWGVLGVVLFAQFSELGLQTFRISSQVTVATIARYVSTMINIVGSRRVEVYVDLPSTNFAGSYIVVISGKTVLVQSSRDSFSCQALYPCISTTLESGRRYLLRSSTGMVVFEGS